MWRYLCTDVLRKHHSMGQKNVPLTFICGSNSNQDYRGGGTLFLHEFSWSFPTSISKDPILDMIHRMQKLCENFSPPGCINKVSLHHWSINSFEEKLMRKFNFIQTITSSSPSKDTQFITFCDIVKCVKCNV